MSERIGDLGTCIQVSHAGTHELRPHCLVIDSEGRCRNPEPPDPGDFDGVACSPLDLGLTSEEEPTLPSDERNPA